MYRGVANNSHVYIGLQVIGAPPCGIAGWLVTKLGASSISEYDMDLKGPESSGPGDPGPVVCWVYK